MHNIIGDVLAVYAQIILVRKSGEGCLGSCSQAYLNSRAVFYQPCNEATYLIRRLRFRGFSDGEQLFYEAKKIGLISDTRTLKESNIHGIYPFQLEETRKIDGEEVTLRPAKPVDERRIQEHFYNLDKTDIVSRFFHEKTSFVRDEAQGVSQIDYIKDLTIVALVGEFGTWSQRTGLRHRLQPFGQNYELQWCWL